MNSKKTMWALGLCASLVLPVVANAAVTCPSGAGITCTPTPSGTECNGDATSDQNVTPITCTLGNAVAATCNNPDEQVGSTNLFASHQDASGVPASCTWSCNDGSTPVDCTIDQDDGLPVTLQKFSVD